MVAAGPGRRNGAGWAGFRQRLHGTGELIALLSVLSHICQDDLRRRIQPAMAFLKRTMKLALGRPQEIGSR